MNDLGPEARSMLEAARGAEAPSRAERDRIKHAVLLRVATVGAVSAASMAAGGAAAMSVAAKITVAALTVAVLGGGTAAVWTWKARAPLPATPTRAALSHTARRIPPTPAAQPVVAPEAPVIEEPRPQPLVPEARRHEVVRGEARRSNAAPVAESTPAPAPTLDSLDPELTALRQAQEDLRAGLPAQALRRLAEYDRRFGAGTLNQERRAIGAIALCQLHPGPAAQAQAERFLRAVPESPLAERVRSACKKLDETTKPVE